MPTSGLVSGRALGILALLVAVALGLRLASAGRLLPHFREPDAFEVYEMQRVQDDPARVTSINFTQRYPWLLAWTLAALPPARAAEKLDASNAETEHLAAAAQPFLRVRIAVALLATLQVLLTFFLARRFLSERAALFAVFLVATSLLQLLFSVEARPHGAHAGLALLALIAALQLAESLSWVRLAVAVITSASAIATLQIGLSTLPPLFLACLLASGRRIGSRIGLAVLAPIAALALARPWYTNWPFIDANGVHLASEKGGGHTLFFRSMDFLGTWRGARILFEHDPVLALLAAAGGVLLLVRARASWKAAGSGMRRALLVAGTFAVPYSLVLTIQGEVLERFLMPLLPFAAILGAATLALLWRKPLARVLAIGLLALPAVSAAQFVRLALVPDSFEQAADWIRRNAPQEAKIAVFPDNSLPLLYSPDAVASQLKDRAARNMPWITYQSTIPALPPGTPAWNVRCAPILAVRSPDGPDVGRMRSWLIEEHVEYLVVEYSRRMWNLPLLPSLEQAAGELGELVFRSSGALPGLRESGVMEYQAIRYLAWRQLHQGALGPEVRIWKLRRR